MTRSEGDDGVVDASAAPETSWQPRPTRRPVCPWDRAGHRRGSRRSPEFAGRRSPPERPRASSRALARTGPSRGSARLTPWQGPRRATFWVAWPRPFPGPPPHRRPGSLRSCAARHRGFVERHRPALDDSAAWSDARPGSRPLTGADLAVWKEDGHAVAAVSGRRRLPRVRDATWRACQRPAASRSIAPASALDGVTGFEDASSSRAPSVATWT